MIFVTHDLGVIADVADDVVVMYAGQIVEQRAASSLFARPRHPYTEALLHSIPQLTPRGEPLHAIPGMVPRPDQFPTGCRFAPRCSYARRMPCGARCPCAQPSDGAKTVRARRDGGPSVRSLARCVRQDELDSVRPSGGSRGDPGPSPDLGGRTGPTEGRDRCSR